MSITEMGRIPECIEEELEDEFDIRGALSVMARDINEACQYSDTEDGICALSKQIMEAAEPIDFDNVSCHIPEWSGYTAHDVIALYCAVAVFNESSTKSAMAVKINDSEEKIDNAGSIEDYFYALQEFMELTEAVRKNSINRYNVWLESCYA